MAKQPSRFRKKWDSVRALWDESTYQALGELSRPRKFLPFWVLVTRSFSRNRCPVRASALAYASLLSLIPMLAVIVSVTSTFLKKEGEDQIDHFIMEFVSSVIPPDVMVTNATGSAVSPPLDDSDLNPLDALESDTEMSSDIVQTNQAAGLHSLTEDDRAVRARRAISHKIHQFIRNTRSGTLGVTGSILLIFAAISMLSRIEDTFNDIWGIVRGRSWPIRILLYWGVITLGPMLLVVAVGLASGPHLSATKKLIGTMPFVGRLIFQFLPVVVLCLTFALFYMLMPNTKVQWKAALVGGTVAGLLLYVNNLISVLYVSRVVSNSKIYGSLGLVPVFMIGLYFGWLILLFGAQVAYAWQNRASYLEEKQIENINQRGREFIALRLMTCIGRRFEKGESPLSVIEMGKDLCVPTRLVHQIMCTLCAARLVTEVAGPESAFVPGRPLETISCYDILHALRASHGQELATRDEPTRVEVFGEFSRIEAAERQAGGSVSLLALVNRAQQQVKTLVESSSG